MPSFSNFWKYTIFNDFSKIIFRGIVIDSLQILIIVTDKILHLCALSGSSYFIISNMSFSVERIYSDVCCVGRR